MSDSIESYLFSLSPKYRHVYPVLENQYSSKPAFNQFCILTTQEYYGRELGLAFGLNREDCRIWIDGKSLKNSFVRNEEKIFKKGNLLPPNIDNLECVMVEVYGVHT